MPGYAKIALLLLLLYLAICVDYIVFIFGWDVTRLTYADWRELLVEIVTVFAPPAFAGLIAVNGPAVLIARRFFPRRTRVAAAMVTFAAFGLISLAAMALPHPSRSAIKLAVEVAAVYAAILFIPTLISSEFILCVLSAWQSGRFKQSPAR